MSQSKPGKLKMNLNINLNAMKPGAENPLQSRSSIHLYITLIFANKTYSQQISTLYHQKKGDNLEKMPNSHPH